MTEAEFMQAYFDLDALVLNPSKSREEVEKAIAEFKALDYDAEQVEAAWMSLRTTMEVRDPNHQPAPPPPKAE